MVFNPDFELRKQEGTFIHLSAPRKSRLAIFCPPPHYSLMVINQLSEQAPFTTKDGSTIRSILDLANAPVEKQSLAEASLPTDAATDRHYHKESEEFYFILEGKGTMEIDGETQQVNPGDGILIPREAWHQLTADQGEPLRLLCCCAPPYQHSDTYFE